MFNPEFIPVYVLLVMLIVVLYLMHKEITLVKTYVTPPEQIPMPTPEEMVESLQVTGEDE